MQEPLCAEPQPDQAEAAVVIRQRDVLDFKNFDTDILQTLEGAKTFKERWKMQLEVGIQLLALFNSVTTIMVIISQLVNRVPDEITNEFGNTTFKALKWTLIIVPLVFFLLLIFMVNNYYSQATFYYYIQRGAVIDFPETAAPKFLLTRPTPLVFILALVGFLSLTIFTTVRFDASTGQIVVIVSNIVIGVALQWYKQQTIEDKFITISQFLQKFPDEEGKFDNMDCHSLDLAAAAMANFTLLKTDGASYGNTMRHRWWKDKNYSTAWMCAIDGFIFFVIAVMAGIGIGFYFFQVSEQELRRWETEITPCISGCQTGFLRASGVDPKMAGNGTAENATAVTSATCPFCICQCLRRFYLRQAPNLCSKALAKTKGNDIGFNTELSCADECPENVQQYCNRFPWYNAQINTTV